MDEKIFSMLFKSYTVKIRICFSYLVTFHEEAQIANREGPDESNKDGTRVRSSSYGES